MHGLVISNSIQKATKALCKDPVHTFGLIRWEVVGALPVVAVVKKLLHIFELPLRSVGKFASEEIINSFNAFRASQRARDVYTALYKNVSGTNIEHGIIYEYYFALQQEIGLGAWSFFALFLLVLPTGNAISERGFSAMGAAHSKERSELSSSQTLAHMVMNFNGPTVAKFAAEIDRDSTALRTGLVGLYSHFQF